MDEDSKKKLEREFREADSFDKIFDAFQLLIEEGVEELNIFKTLLANNCLSYDERIFFLEKICEKYPKYKFELFLWIGELYSYDYLNSNHLEKSFAYYIKAVNVDKSSFQPYVAIASLYNPEIEYPEKESIINLLKFGLKEVKIKSRICYALADLFEKLENEAARKQYLLLASKYSKEESKM